MHFTAYLPLVVCIVGLIIYSLSSKPKVERVGWYMFVVGMAVTLVCNCGAVFSAAIFGVK